MASLIPTVDQRVDIYRRWSGEKVESQAIGTLSDHPGTDMDEYSN